jgi:hypothetical protein
MTIFGLYNFRVWIAPPTRAVERCFSRNPARRGGAALDAATGRERGIMTKGVNVNSITGMTL